MGLDEFVGKIKEEFSEDYNVGDLNPDTHIKFPWKSLKIIDFHIFWARKIQKINFLKK